MDVEGLIEEMRRKADDWRRPNLRQVEGPGDLKIYGGTIADDIDRWAEALSRQKAAGDAMAEALEEIADAIWPSVNNDDPVERIRAFARRALNSIGADREG